MLAPKLFPGSVPALRPHPGLQVVRPLAAAAAGPALPRVDLRTLILLRLGDEAAREQFVHTWAPIVEREALHYSQKGGPPEDLQAEGMLALWEAALYFDPSRHRTQPERFIHNQVHRRVRRHYRDAMGFEAPQQVPLELVPESAAAEAGFAAAEQRIDLATATQQLTPKDQHVFAVYAAHAAAGAGPDEAARALSATGNSSFAAWKKRIERVRKRLKSRLLGVPSDEA